MFRESMFIKNGVHRIKAELQKHTQAMSINLDRPISWKSRSAVAGSKQNNAVIDLVKEK